MLAGTEKSISEHTENKAVWQSEKERVGAAVAVLFRSQTNFEVKHHHYKHWFSFLWNTSCIWIYRITKAEEMLCSLSPSKVTLTNSKYDHYLQVLMWNPTKNAQHLNETRLILTLDETQTTKSHFSSLFSCSCPFPSSTWWLRGKLKSHLSQDPVFFAITTV